jgi:phosphopantetheine--protein transferase-like protein
MSIRNNKMEKIYVYYAPIPTEIEDRELYPRERMDEINGCKNDGVKRDKYYSWALLEYAVRDALSLDFNNLQFTKLSSGQWICDGCRFSISHTDGAVAAAVSDSDVGVDIEAVHDIDERIANKALTDAELSHYKRLKDGSREEYLLESWCKKEAVFKAFCGEVFLPREIETDRYMTQIARVVIDEWEYVIAVSAKEPFDVKLIEAEI